MHLFLIAFAVALAFSGVSFKKYVWFISIVSQHPSMPLPLLPPRQRFTFAESSQPPAPEQRTGVSPVCSTE